MASLVTFADLKTRARQLADMEFSQFVSDDEVGYYINAGAQGLYDLLISAGELYKITSTSISLVANQDTYSLPSDFYKLLGVDLSSQGQPVTLKKFEFAERNKYSYYPFYNTRGLTALKYIVQGDSLRFIPMPNSNDSITVWYAPTMPALVNDADTFDGVNGWEDYIVFDAAIKMLIKEESDPTAIMSMKKEVEQSIQKMKVIRDQGGQYKVSDVTQDTIMNRFGVEY
jgi:hypothetical protein